MLNGPQNKDSFIGQLSTVLVAPSVALENVSRFRDWLYTLGANDDAIKLQLVALYSVTADEATTILNSINALNQLRIVANAGATVAQVDDFFFHAKKVWGFNPIRA